MPEASITCPVCSAEERTDAPVALADVGLFVCNACGSRVVLGKVMLRVVVEPFCDARGFRWVRTRYQDPKTKADVFVDDRDPQHAANVAKNILSVVIP